MIVTRTTKTVCVIAIVSQFLRAIIFITEAVSCREVAGQDTPLLLPDIDVSDTDIYTADSCMCFSELQF